MPFVEAADGLNLRMVILKKKRAAGLAQKLGCKSKIVDFLSEDHMAWLPVRADIIPHFAALHDAIVFRD